MRCLITQLMLSSYSIKWCGLLKGGVVSKIFAHILLIRTPLSRVLDSPLHANEIDTHAFSSPLYLLWTILHCSTILSVASSALFEFQS